MHGSMNGPPVVMEPCGGPPTATPPFFVFEASNVPWTPDTEQTGTLNYTEENTLLSRMQKKTILTFCNDK